MIQSILSLKDSNDLHAKARYALEKALSRSFDMLQSFLDEDDQGSFLVDFFIMTCEEVCGDSDKSDK